MALTDEDKQWISERLDAFETRFSKAMVDLVTGVKESLEREIGEVKDSGSRMEARLDKIAAGAHYVTRLVEWSEKQDSFQADILRRVQALERKIEGHNGKA